LALKDQGIGVVRNLPEGFDGPLAVTNGFVRIVEVSANVYFE
jgi:hypothetical protein